MNKIILSGNLTRDVEYSVTSSGVPFCKFTLAVNRQAGGERTTDFFNVVAWRKLAENCNTYLHKGDKVLICGEMTTRKYDRDGKTNTIYEIQANDVEFMPKTTTATAEAPAAPTPPKAEQTTMIPVNDDNLPF